MEVTEPLPDLIVGLLASTLVDDGAWRFELDDHNRSFVVVHFEYDSDVDGTGACGGDVILWQDSKGVIRIEEKA